MARIYLLLVAAFIPFLSMGQDFYTEDFVYLESIKSVKLTPAGEPLKPPVVSLTNGGRLQLSFDDLDARDKRYTYYLYHCNRNWEISEIGEIEYLDGFNGEEIRDSYHSVQSKTDYVHYDLYLPNDYVRWTISGNYLLVVYDEEDFPVISRRFLVVEPLVSVFADFAKVRDVSKHRSHQSLDVSINFEDVYIRDPLNELTVTVLQNFRWTDAIEHVKPKNLIGTQLTFDAFDPFLFPGLKEFRNFDIRSLNYTTRFVYAIRASLNGIEVQLEKDKKRSYTNFISEPDVDGNFLTGNEDDPYGLRAAEYANVSFTLESPLPIEDHDVYVTGGFSDWQLYDSHRMSYDPVMAAYQLDLMLKQGFYDYYYALVDKNGGMDLTALEGSWYETDNTYYILVYLREFSSYYDKLIALYTVR